MPHYDAILATPIGSLGVVVRDRGVARIDVAIGDAAPRPPANPVAARAVSELEAYFTDPGHAFDLPLTPDGTDFQRRVWRALAGIPPGRTLTYGALAHRLGTSARAVGGACRANPCPIVVPCHRVVASGGGLGGYSGARHGRWLDIKRRLLEHEAAWR